MSDYAVPRNFDAHVGVLEWWLSVNPQALAVIEMKVVQLAMNGQKRIYASQLIEHANDELGNRTKDVTFTDQDGHDHKYRLSNASGSALCRILYERRPTLGVEYRAREGK